MTHLGKRALICVNLSCCRNREHNCQQQCLFYLILLKNDVRLKATYLGNIPFADDPSMLTDVMRQYGYNIKTPVGSGRTQAGGNPNNPASKLFN